MDTIFKTPQGINPTDDSKPLLFIEDNDNVPVRFWLSNLLKQGILERYEAISKYEYKITFKK